MQITPIGPKFGAEIRGVTLKQVAADEGTYKDVRAAFEQHSVLVFRDQETDDEAQLAFTRKFGAGVTLHFDQALGSSEANTFDALLRAEYRWGW